MRNTKNNCNNNNSNSNNDNDEKDTTNNTTTILTTIITTTTTIIIVINATEYQSKPIFLSTTERTRPGGLEDLLGPSSGVSPLHCCGLCSRCRKHHMVARCFLPHVLPEAGHHAVEIHSSGWENA